jgi:hypothetical protein
MQIARTLRSLFANFGLFRKKRTSDTPSDAKRENSVWIRINSILTIILSIVLGAILFNDFRYRDLVIDSYGAISWNTFFISADSMGWTSPYTVDSARPPVYPTFVRLVLRLFGFDPDRIDWSIIPMGARTAILTDHPVLLLIKTQKIVYLSCVLLSAMVLMRRIFAPIIFVGVLWFFNNGYYPAEIDGIMSEALTQAWLFVLVAITVYSILSPSIFYLYLLAIGCAFHFHIRSAGIYVVVIFAWVALYLVLLDYTRYLKAAVGAVLTLVFLMAMPSIYRYIATGFFSPAPMYADSRIAFALEVAHPEDVEIISDPQARELLVKMFALKNELDSGYRAKGNITSGLQLLGSNLYYVANVLSDSLHYDHVLKRKLFLEISEPILKKRWQGYLALILESFGNAVNGISRLSKSPFPSFWILSAAIFAGAILAFNKYSILGIGFYLGHMAHLVVVCLFDVPQPRFVFATEMLVLISILVIGCGLLLRLGRLSATALQKFARSYRD